MSSNFSSLRSSRKNLLGKLAEAVKNETAKAGADERFWKLSIDQKTGRGYARFRFLPAPPNEELPWARFYQHNFKGASGAWLVEHCPTTNGNNPCPVCKENTRLWNLGGTNNDTQQKIARDRKRKLQFISNILMVDDTSHPENNGKVFLFKYGIKIHEKIMDAIEPKFPTDKPLNPFDMWDDGADFKLKAEKKDDYQNYDKSEFADPAPIKGTEAELEAIWQSEKSLLEFVSDKQFKSYEALEKRLDSVVSGEARGPKTAEEAIKSGTDLNDAEVEEVVALAAKEEAEVKPSPARRKPKQEPVAVAPDDDDEDKLTAFFSKVAAD